MVDELDPGILMPVGPKGTTCLPFQRVGSTESKKNRLSFFLAFFLMSLFSMKGVVRTLQIIHLKNYCSTNVFQQYQPAVSMEKQCTLRQKVQCRLQQQTVVSNYSINIAEYLKRRIQETKANKHKPIPARSSWDRLQRPRSREG